SHLTKTSLANDRAEAHAPLCRNRAGSPPRLFIKGEIDGFHDLQSAFISLCAKLGFLALAVQLKRASTTVGAWASAPTLSSHARFALREFQPAGQTRRHVRRAGQNFAAILQYSG